jgi:hypothetical protein
VNLNETTEAVDAAVKLLRQQMEKLAANPRIDEEEARGLEAMRNMAAEIIKAENNRFGPLVAMIAGRRGLDKLPAGDLARLVQVITGDGVKAIEGKKGK